MISRLPLLVTLEISRRDIRSPDEKFAINIGKPVYSKFLTLKVSPGMQHSLLFLQIPLCSKDNDSLLAIAEDGTTVVVDLRNQSQLLRWTPGNFAPGAANQACWRFVIISSSFQRQVSFPI